MPALQNTGGGFNLGRDVTIIAIGQLGVPLQINNVTGFKSEGEYAQVTVDRLDGIQENVAIPKGWTYSLEFDRADANVDEFAAAIEDNWYNSGFISTGQIFEIINEKDGSQTTWLYDNATFMLDAGQWKGDSSVKCVLKGKANRKVQQ